MPFFSRKKKDSPSNSAPVTGLASHSQPVYPWSAHALTLGNSPSPFPRHDHALSTTATAAGELFLFGGYAHGSNRNDLYVFSTRDFSTTLLQTSGETPGPRVGHGVALTSTHLLVWGGYTKPGGKNIQYKSFDDSLHLLNLGMSKLLMSRSAPADQSFLLPVSREWTRVVDNGPGPWGRNYHTVTLIGSKLFVFGGKIFGMRLNDIWGIDLNLCTFAPLFHEPF